MLRSLTLVLLGALIGCEIPSPPPELGYVEGIVTMDDEPLPEAAVEFVPVDRSAPPSYGETQDNGFYVMEYTFNKEGAPVGENIVRISTVDLEEDERGNEVQSLETVPARYNVRAADNPEMHVTVEPGDNVFDFELTSDGEIIQPTEL